MNILANVLQALGAVAELPLRFENSMPIFEEREAPRGSILKFALSTLRLRHLLKNLFYVPLLAFEPKRILLEKQKAGEKATQANKSMNPRNVP